MRLNDPIRVSDDLRTEPRAGPRLHGGQIKLERARSQKFLSPFILSTITRLEFNK